LFFISVYFSGRGRTIGDGDAADVLQQALLPVEGYNSCEDKMKIVRKRVYEEEMLCAVSQAGKGSCQIKTIVYFASSNKISEHSEIGKSQPFFPYFRSVGRFVRPSVCQSFVLSLVQ